MELEQTYRFQTECTIDLATIKEVNRGYSLFSNRFRITRGILIAVLCFNLILLLTLDFYSETFLGYTAICAVVFLIIKLINRNGGVAYKRMLSNNNGKPVTQIYGVAEDGIYCVNKDTGNHVEFRYEQVRSLAQTENFLVVMLEFNQYLAFDKRNLIGGSPDELTGYLVQHCPKLKPKRLRSNLPGKIINTVLLIVLCISILVSVYTLPAVQRWVDSTRPINNSMTYQQIADALVPYGITIEDEAMIAELEQYYAEYQQDTYFSEYYPNFSKVSDLLGYAGYGTYAEDTWEWTPSTCGVYWFDTEVMNIDTACTDFLRGISALNSDALSITDIREEISEAGTDSGYTVHTVTFCLNGEVYQAEADMDYDWFDVRFADRINEIIQSRNTGKQLYFAQDDWGCLMVFYGDAAWAREFEAATGIDLKPRADGASWF